MEVIKVVYNDEIRRISLKSLIPNGSIDEISFKLLSDKIKEIYPALGGRAFKLLWVDDESDVIAVTTTFELNEALLCMKSLSSSTYKFTIQEFNGSLPTAEKVSEGASSETANQEVHNRITCDGCGQSPLKGIRYKCTVRDDFDLCERCESSKKQPYPMIKIYSPDQAPLAILVAVRNGHGHHEGHPRHFPRGPGRCGRFRKFDTNEPSENNYGRWARNAAKAFVSVVESVVEPIQKELLEKTEDAEATEQKFIDEAIRLSTCESKCSANEDIRPTKVFAETTPQFPRLKGRYIRDITYPDGSVISPGSTFEKVWLIRNDGTVDWKDGTVLVTAGGDYLCDPSIKVPVPILKSGEEGDVVIPLVAPSVEGRFTSYFRLQSPDGETFGQRLWSDINVIEEEEIGWTVVNNKESSDSAKEIRSNETVISDVSSSSISITSSIGSTNNDVAIDNSVPKSNNWGVAVESDMEDTPIVESFSQDELIWSSELTLLREIGFTDKNVCIPLLVEHLKSPCGGAQPDPVAMQRVVMQLLGQSLSGY